MLLAPEGVGHQHHGRKLQEMDTATQDDEIRRDIEDSQPLLGSAEPIDVLLEQYKDNAPFLPKIEVRFGAVEGLVVCFT